jgi:hypothetical protein
MVAIRGEAKPATLAARRDDCGFEPAAKPPGRLHPFGARLQRRRHADDGREVLRAGPVALLLPSHRLDHAKVAHEQCADARGASELVGGKRDHVGVRERQLARALRAVGEEQAAFAAHVARNRLERLDYAGLVVDVLDGDQRPFALHLPSIDDAVAVDGEPASAGAARSTASCSTAETNRVPPFPRPSAMARASLAPEVKMILPCSRAPP